MSNLEKPISDSNTAQTEQSERQPTGTHCASCGMALPPGARFCLNCGQAVHEKSAGDQAQIVNLVAAAPQPLVEKVRAASYLSGERRQVTAVFIDIVDSTTLMEQIGPDGWRAVMGSICDWYCSAIYRYEGTIARFVGDEMLAFFGAPVAHEDDPVRAVHAALEILDAVKRRVAHMRQEYGLEIQVRISVSSGPVTIGPVSSDLQFEYSALKGSLNLAARLEATKRAMAVLVSEETYRLVAPFFQALDLGPVEIADQSGVVHIYQISGPKAALSRQRSLASQKSPLVGRERELSSLLQLADAVSAGLGRAVLISGESGLGKTRLLSEWQSAVSQSPTLSPLQWASGLCLSYNQGTAYYLLRDLLRSLIGVSSISSEPETRAALHALCADLFGESAVEVYPYLGHLLAIKLDDQARDRLKTLDPPGLQAQVLAATRRLILALAGRDPLILILEDLQWADPSSVAILSRLLPLATAAPVLFCLITRPERDSAGWKLVLASREVLGSRFSQLPLGLLSEEQSRQLVQNLLQADALPPGLPGLIMNKAEGNPLFIEELLHMMIDQGVIQRRSGRWTAARAIDAQGIPDNLQGLLIARLDRLSESARQILRVAAVIGRRFPLPILEKVTGQSGMALLNHLGDLESNGLIEVCQVKPELTYRFQNTLLLDAVYASLLPADRERLHCAVGEAMEQLYPEKREQMASQLARHFHEGGQAAAALAYYALAGDLALESNANQEAQGRFRMALALDPPLQERAELIFKLGQALFWQSQFKEAIQVWGNGIPLYQALGDSDGVARMVALSARAVWNSGDTPGGLQMCQEGLALVQDAPDSPGMALLLHEAARAYLFNGNPTEARRLGEQALAMATHLGDVTVQAEALATLGLLSDQPPQEALACLTRAAELAEAAGLLSQAARAHVNLAALKATSVPDFPAACRHYQKAAQLHHLRGNLAGELLGLGGMTGVLLEMGDLAEVQKTLPVMQELLDELANPGPEAFHMQLSDALLRRYRGDLAEAARRLRELQGKNRQRGNLQNLSDINLSLAEVILESHLLADQEATGGWPEAEEALEEVISIGNRWQRPGVKPRCLLSMVHTAQGHLPQGRYWLSEARSQIAANPVAQDEGWPELAAARLAVAENRWLQAKEFYAAAEKIFQRLQMSWLRARLLLDWAEMQVSSKEPTGLEQARAHLQDASAAFGQMGSPFYQKLAQERLQKLEVESYAQAVAHQRVEQEMAAAGKIQVGLLPDKTPSIPGWQLAAALDPSRQTSGDFYDFIALGDGRWGLVIADVADKGLAAALFMALSSSLIRTYAVGNQDHPQRVLLETNRRILADTHTDLFVTVFYAVLDPATGSVTYANAGHNPPYLFQGSAGNRVALNNTGIPLGILKEAAWEVQTVQIAAGDVLVLYTDGITEAQGPEGSFFTSQRLQEIIQANRQRSAAEIQEAILKATHQFAAGVPQFDDITLIVLKREQARQRKD